MRHALLLVAILLLSGCILTDRYVTRTVDPETGEVITEERPSPLSQAVSAAGGGGMSTGTWQGAVGAGVPALLIALWQSYRAQKMRKIIKSHNAPQKDA